jgi:hypothetical protein
MWRKWFKPLGARVIATVDIGGEIRFRFAKFTKYGVICEKIYGKILLPLDGSGNGYIAKWFEI